MTDENLFSPMDKMLELGLGIAFAQQMVKTMNNVNETVNVPGSFASFKQKQLLTICAKCGSHNSINSKFCNNCGFELAKGNKKTCSKCNTANELSAKFCSECGNNLTSSNCKECNAVNELSAKFCQNCGKSLNKQSDEI